MEVQNHGLGYGFFLKVFDYFEENPNPRTYSTKNLTFTRRTLVESKCTLYYVIFDY